MAKKKTQVDFLAAALRVHGDRYDYSKSIYAGATSELLVICNKCKTEFNKTPHKHISSKQGCPKCSREKVLAILALYSGAFVKNTDDFIQKATSIHKDKFDYSQVEYINAETPALIKCNNCKKTFDQSPHAHTRTKNCPICCGKRKDTIIFIEQSKKIHENKYDYSLVEYIDSTTKVLIICNKCKNEFPQKPNTHLQGHGCPFCAREKVAADNTKPFAQFVIEANIIHNQKYDYSNSVYINSYTEIDILCKNCEKVFPQTPHGHLSGNGCQQCAFNRAWDASRHSLQDFIEKAIIVHENDYNYSMVEYINSNTKVSIICNFCSKSFPQKPRDHLKGRGCPHCHRDRRKSQCQWLTEIGISEQCWEQVIYIDKKRYNVDAFVQETKTIYEFYGDYWHGNPNVFDADHLHPDRKISFGEIYENTIKRANKLQTAGFNLIYIWEHDWLKLKKHKEVA